MLTTTEYSFLLEKIHGKLNDAAGLISNEERLELLLECQHLIGVLAKSARPLEWFAERYPELTFRDTGSGKIVIAPASYTRAEAIDARNALVHDGLTVFRLQYGAYGAFVEPLEESPEAGALEEMRRFWGQEWNIFRAENDSYNFVCRTRYDGETAVRLAESFLTELKERYPWGWIVVRVPVVVQDGEQPMEVRRSKR